MKDIDLDRRQIVIRRGKGQKDRPTVLPTAVTRAVGCSRVHLSRLFKRETGFAVHRWLVWLRLHHAAEELRKGEKVEAVVKLVGYRSKRAFMHQFRSCYGCSPGEFRQRLIDTIRSSTRFPPITNAHPI